MVRGNLMGNGRFDLNSNWRTGFDVATVTDKTYLARYKITSPDVLTNRLFVEGFRARSYAAVNGYTFQDVRSGPRPEEPLVMPDMRFSALGEPGRALGGRWSLDSGLLAIKRTQGADVRRASLAGGWERTYISGLGFMTTFDANVRGDGYWTDRLPDPSTPNQTFGNDLKGRIFPLAQTTMRYPFVRREGELQERIEPIASIVGSPVTPNDTHLPNEDSQDLEFDSTNLLRPNRFSGVDRQEGGSRLIYGLRSGLYHRRGNGDLFFGQSYRLTKDNNIPVGSGLETKASDYVGRLETRLASWIDADYSFRLDHKTFARRRQDVTAAFGHNPLQFTASYLFIDRNALVATDKSHQELSYGARADFYKYWFASGNQLFDLSQGGGLLTTTVRLGYTDECFSIIAVADRNNTIQADGTRTGSSYMVNLNFKNLGGFGTPEK